jgi:molybdate transport system regulatory protein
MNEKMKETKEIKELKSVLTIRLAKEEVFFGPGVATLLKLTKELESLNGAAKAMNMSYSKATRMIKNAEKALDLQLLERKIGGAGGGGSQLTEECIVFLEKYSAFEKEIKEYAEKALGKHFEGY